MKKIPFFLGLVSLGIWLLWFIIQATPTISFGGIGIDPEILNLMYHGLFVTVCLVLIIFGVSGKEESK